MEEQLYLFMKRLPGLGGYEQFLKMPLKTRRHLYENEMKVIRKEISDAE